MTKDDDRPVAPGATGATYNEPEIAERVEHPTPAPADRKADDEDQATDDER